MERIGNSSIDVQRVGSLVVTHSRPRPADCFGEKLASGADQFVAEFHGEDEGARLRVDLGACGFHRLLGPQVESFALALAEFFGDFLDTFSHEFVGLHSGKFVFAVKRELVGELRDEFGWLIPVG